MWSYLASGSTEIRSKETAVAERRLTWSLEFEQRLTRRLTEKARLLARLVYGESSFYSM